MGRALAELSAGAGAVWREADEALSFSLSRLCFEGPADALALTANTQPAVLTASVAAAVALAERGLTPDLAAWTPLMLMLVVVSSLYLMQTTEVAGQ